ncbi:hypothetical protein ACIA5G_51855 [Amycolatopsis sp. NPDC051758]|uniref:hypothetical protein n=1 Tax=Amycolatopsis sp. NPDC051758 TaxID=3363935 RepID=UPI003798F85B
MLSRIECATAGYRFAEPGDAAELRPAEPGVAAKLHPRQTRRRVTRTVSNMSSRRWWTPRLSMDGEAVWDHELRRFATPEACRSGHPLEQGMKTSEIDWLEYRCPMCVAESAPDPFFRLRKPARI